MSTFTYNFCNWTFLITVSSFLTIYIAKVVGIFTVSTNSAIYKNTIRTRRVASKTTGACRDLPNNE